MLLTLHDASLKKVAYIDNNKQGTLNYYDDTWTRSLETGSSTFEFTVFKKAIQSDTAAIKSYSWLNEKAFVSFEYRGKSYIFNVMTVEENEQTITCYCENLNLELINAYNNPYEATEALSFEAYCRVFGILGDGLLSIGLNEISDKKRKLSWDGQDTKLARLISLARKFEAEIDFEVQLNRDSTIRSFLVNVYHENDDKHQGVGKVRDDLLLTYGKNLTSITRKVDKTGLYTKVRPVGKRTVKNAKDEEVEEPVTIEGLPAFSEKNKDGIEEFYQKGDALYAPIAAQLYPSTFASGDGRSQWIQKDLEVDSDSPSVIRAAGLRNLKKNAYPAISYEVDGFLDVEIGDTVTIYDDGFSPALIVRARVSEQKVSFTNPQSNKTTFANFKALENQISSGLQAAFERLFEASRPYSIKLSTDNGVMFKNHSGQSTVIPTLYRGGKAVIAPVAWHWSMDDDNFIGGSYQVRGIDVETTSVLKVDAVIDDAVVASTELTFTNVNDGVKGDKGNPGQQGEPGQDGASHHLLTTAYRYNQANINIYGRVGYSGTWNVNEATTAIKVGDTVQISVYNTDKMGESWILATVKAIPSNRSVTTTTKGLVDKGEKGDRGSDGIAGRDGVGIRATTITYAGSANGTTAPTSGWSASVPVVSAGNYLWTKTVWTYTDNHTETGYAVSRIGRDGNTGRDGIAGKDGVGIRATAITYASSTNGTTPPSSGWSTSVPSVPDGQYLWTKTVWTYTDNTSETGYSVAKMGQQGPKGDKGDRGERGLQGLQGLQGPKGEQGIAGAKGADGRTQYTHIAYADTITGDGFSQTDQTKAYIGMYQDFNATDSNNPASYRWSKWKGSDGAQGVPGPKGADGRTPYFHVAYAESADGRTGFSLTQTGNKRYMGTYTDFIQADSQDHTKYRWVDMVGTVEVGGRNYLRNANFSNNGQYWEELKNGFSELSFNYDHSRNNRHKPGVHFWHEVTSTTSFYGIQQKFSLLADRGTKLSISLLAAKDACTSGLRVALHHIRQNSIVSQDWKIIPNSDLATAYKKFSFIFTLPNDVDELRLMLFGENGKTADFYVTDVKVELGTTATDFSLSQDDIDQAINSKADQVLTQQQLNALAETTQLHDVELKAKVSMEAFSQLELATKAFIATSQAEQKKAEASLIEAANRIDLLATEFGGMKELKTFIDTYMTNSNEGLIIGKQDGSSTIRVSHDRISMFSAGTEVMYISQGLIHIDNGVFTLTLQIGRFRTEQYHLNADMNVIRYIN